jgi:arylsulfatase
MSSGNPVSESHQVLPKPEQPFGGKIGTTYKDSTPDFPKESRHPEVHPTLSFVLLDDIGYGQASVFGGPVPTPHI